MLLVLSLFLHWLFYNRLGLVYLDRLFYNLNRLLRLGSIDFLAEDITMSLRGRLSLIFLIRYN